MDGIIGKISSYTSLKSVGKISSPFIELQLFQLSLEKSGNLGVFEYWYTMPGSFRNVLLVNDINEYWIMWRYWRSRAFTFSFFGQKKGQKLSKLQKLCWVITVMQHISYTLGHRIFCCSKMQMNRKVRLISRCVR